MASLGTSIWIMLSLLTLQVKCKIQEARYELWDELFGEYNKFVRPAEFENVTTVYMKFFLLSLVDVREKDQVIVTNAELEMDWHDAFLSWDHNKSAKWYSVSSLLVEQQMIWLPDIVVGNSVTAQDHIGYDELRVRIDRDGKITWRPSSVISTSCDIIITFYPFDTQVCSIDFETAISKNTEVVVMIDPDAPISSHSYNENGQWDLVDASAQDLSSTSSGEEKTKIRFQLKLKRRTAFYWINVIIPIVCLSFLSPTVFALPPVGGEKIAIAVSVLLSYSVYISTVSGQLPNTSVQNSLLSIYLTALVGTTSLSVINAIAIVRMHHKPETEPVSQAAKTMAFIFAKITCSHISLLPKQTCRSNSVVPEESSKSKKKIPDDPVDNHDSVDITWKDVARVTDWFCFLLYSLIVVGGTISFLAAMTIGPQFNQTHIGGQKWSVADQKKAQY